MRGNGTFQALSVRLEEIHVMREQAAADAFIFFEKNLSAFSEMLVNGLGDRSHAIRWMCTRHRKFDGRNGYQVLADGEQDLLWDEMERACGFAMTGQNHGVD